MLDYIAVFLAVAGLNVVPFLMPPTWLVLAFFYNNFTLDPLALAFAGATASTTGRFLLTYAGTFSRRFVGKERKRDMDFVGRLVKVHPVKSFFVTFLLSLSPFPSNVYFIGVGLAKARSAAVFAGFFFGRLISYYVLLRVSQAIFTSMEEMFSSKLAQIVVIDAVGIAFMAAFLLIDWHALLKERRLKIIPIRLKKP